jgi:hypothetical protein
MRYSRRVAIIRSRLYGRGESITTRKLITRNPQKLSPLCRILMVGYRRQKNDEVVHKQRQNRSRCHPRENPTALPQLLIQDVEPLFPSQLIDDLRGLVMVRPAFKAMLECRPPKHHFHQDDQGNWVADLECGHSQHVRHDPPWALRPWVLTPEGRASHLGRELNCKSVNRPRPKGDSLIALPEYTPPTFPFLWTGYNVSRWPQKDTP